MRFAWAWTPVVALTLVAAGRSGAQGVDVDRGRGTYKELCAKCHGSSGRGDGKEAATLATRPKDLTDCDRMAQFTDEKLFRVVRNGGKAEELSDDMPGYADAMDDDEIRDVVGFLRTLCKQ